jgi:outer membrane autotransporter protein
MQQTSRIAFGMVSQRQTQGYMAGLMADAGYSKALRLFADAGTSMSDAGLGYSGGETLNGFYLTPYIAGIKKRDEEPVGYKADVMGFVLGYDRKVGDNLYSAFVGYSQTEVDYSGLLYDVNDEDQNQFTLGVNALVPISKLTLRGQLAGFFGSHDFEGMTGIDLDVAETADYDSNGVGFTLMGGYPIEKDKHLFLPELGVEVLYAKLDGFTSDAEGASNWEIDSDSESTTNFTTVLNLQWTTELEFGGIAMMPSASVGLRHLFTDEVLEVTQTIGGSSPFTVESAQNKTSGTGSASLRFGKDTLTAEIGYAGELGDESTVNNFWLQVYYNF